MIYSSCPLTAIAENCVLIYFCNKFGFNKHGIIAISAAIAYLAERSRLLRI